MAFLGAEKVTKNFFCPPDFRSFRERMEKTGKGFQPII